MALLDFGGTPQYLGGLLGEDELKRLQGQASDQAMINMATALLQAGAPSRTPGGGALAIAQGLQQGQQAYKSALNQGLQEKMIAMQMGEQIRKTQEAQRMREMFPQIFKVSETPAVTEQAWSGSPEEIGNYFQTGQIPTRQVSPAQRNVSVDTNKLQALAAMSSNPLETLSTMAKLVPDLRKAGFTGGQQNLENPFTVYANDATVPPALRQVALNYQKSYDAGLIDQETADKRLADLGARVQSAQQFAQTQQSLAEQRQQANALQAQMLDIRKAAEANKPEQFSYSQKKDFDVVQQSMDDARKASTNAAIAQRAAPLLEKAYSGVIEAGTKGIAGAVGFETEAKTANDQLSRLSNQLAVNAPKFSGPTSDRDAARYDAAVGDLANPRKTVESKRQALKDIQDLSKKAQNYATQQENWFYNNNKSLRGFKFSENPYDGM